MTNDTSLESSYALLSESDKNIENWQKFKFFAKSSYIEKMFAIPNMQKVLQSF